MGPEYDICGPNISNNASAFYFDIRYMSHEECHDACASMTVISNLKYKIKAPHNEDGKIILFFTKEVEIIEETLMKSFLSFGNIWIHLHIFSNIY